MPNSGPNGEWLATTPEFWAKITRPVVACQIWYADGSYSLDWDNSPNEGVQIVMLHHPEGNRHVIAGKDEYILPGHGSKLGLMIDTEEFYRIYATAMADEWRP